MSKVKFVDQPKMGLVFVEFTLPPRRGIHIYDRKGSAASTLTPEDYDWSEVLRDVRFAYLDGIFPALSENCFQASLAYSRAARQAGCRICFDVNFRESLWSGLDARAAISTLLEHASILITNRTISENLFGYSGSDHELMQAYRSEFGCELVCLTYKEMRGTQAGSWRALALEGDALFESRLFEFQVVDPYGSGDAFVAGLLYGLMEDYDLAHALNFGGALCALSHALEGDQAAFSPSEVAALLREDYALTVKR
jgi:2-dehydro-3-deoxygluconokinase